MVNCERLISNHELICENVMRYDYHRYQQQVFRRMPPYGSDLPTLAEHCALFLSASSAFAVELRSFPTSDIKIKRNSHMKRLAFHRLKEINFCNGCGVVFVGSYIYSSINTCHSGSVTPLEIHHDFILVAMQ